MYQNKKRYALTNCVLLDGTEHMAPQTRKTVYISGDTIVDIGDGGQIAAGYEPVDLKGKYLLPGLITCMCICRPPESPGKSPPTPRNW